MDIWEAENVSLQFSCYAAIKVMRIKQKTGTKEKPASFDAGFRLSS